MSQTQPCSSELLAAAVAERFRPETVAIAVWEIGGSYIVLAEISPHYTSIGVGALVKSWEIERVEELLLDSLEITLRGFA